MKTPLFCGLLVLLSGCSSVNPPAWPPVTLRPFWTANLPAIEQPTLSGDVYLTQQLTADQTNTVGMTAVNTRTHQVQWRDNLPAPSRVDDPLLIYGNYATTYQGRLINFSLGTGLVIRDPNTNTKFRTIPFPADVYTPKGSRAGHTHWETYRNLLLIPLNDVLLAYDMDDLVGGASQVAPIWNVTFPALGTSVQDIDNISVDQQNGTVAFTVIAQDEVKKTTSTTLHVLNATSGAERWKKVIYQDQTSDTLTRGTTGAGEGVVVVNLIGEAKFMGFDLNGQQLFETGKFYCPGGGTDVYDFMVVKNGQFYPVPHGDACISAWNLRTGQQNWVFAAPSGLDNTFAQVPLILNGVVYGTNGVFWALDEQTGAVLGRSDRMSRVQGFKGTPTYDARNNQMLVWGDQLYAFRPVK